MFDSWTVVVEKFQPVSLKFQLKVKKIMNYIKDKLLQILSELAEKTY